MDLETLVKHALEEDIGHGDLTTELTISRDKIGAARIMSRTGGIISGTNAFTEVFRQLDESITIKWAYKDGQPFMSDVVICELQGSARALLTGERTALNFLGRLSGIASTTKEFVDKVSHTKTIILDTRKTTPLLRSLEKAAVRHGGGGNHRRGLYDMILVKDNHEDAAGGITKSLQLISDNLVGDVEIEVEVQSPDQLVEVLEFKVNRILLDNFSIDMIKDAVEYVSNRVPLEVSGGVTLENVRKIAETGVDFISIGAITHSASCTDFSMQIYR